MGLVCRWFGVVKFLRVIRYDIVRRLSTVIRLLVFHFGRRSVVASLPQPLRRFSRSVLSVLIPRNLDFASCTHFKLSNNVSCSQTTSGAENIAHRSACDLSGDTNRAVSDTKGDRSTR